MTKKCNICKCNISKKNILSHYELCCENKIKNLLIEFDNEFTKKDLEHNFIIDSFKEILNLSDLCKKCKYYSSNDLDIEDNQLTYLKKYS